MVGSQTHGAGSSVSLSQPRLWSCETLPVTSWQNRKKHKFVLQLDLHSVLASARSRQLPHTRSVWDLEDFQLANFGWYIGAPFHVERELTWVPDP